MVELTFGLVTTAESNQQLCSKCNSISTCLLSFCADVTSALSLCITIIPDLWQCLSCVYRGHAGSGWCPRGEERNKQINTNTLELLHFPLMESAWKKNPERPGEKRDWALNAAEKPIWKNITVSSLCLHLKRFTKSPLHSQIVDGG